MSDIPQGYREIPEEDRKKAQLFFERGRTVADTGNYEYSIEMYLTGLDLDPDAVEAHQALREISLKRKAGGGKDLGMFEKMRLKRSGKDEKQNMLNAEKLMAYDPGNTDHMLSLLQNAHRGGFYDTVLWIGPILQRANADSGRGEDFNKYIILKDIYKDLRQWQRAVDACQHAVAMRPDDMDLTGELKNLGAQQTMDSGKYGTAGSFRESVRDAEHQHELIEADRDVRTSDSLQRAVMQTEAEWKADPDEPGKLMKYVEALVRTEKPENEQQAIEVLNKEYDRTKQFRFRLAAGRIRLSQLSRRERALRAEVQANPDDESARQGYANFVRERAQEELEEYRLWSKHYPTDMGFKYQTAVRMFQLEQHSEAIPVFQQARSDPKYRTDAGVLLGRAFLEADFVDEAVDTLKSVIDDYELRGDAKSRDMWYWYGRALEKKGETQPALKCYSQVAQWDFNFRDVQARIKRLRVG